MKCLKLGKTHEKELRSDARLFFIFSKIVAMLQSCKVATHFSGFKFIKKNRLRLQPIIQNGMTGG
jgi:hypothetical protein